MTQNNIRTLATSCLTRLIISSHYAYSARHGMGRWSWIIEMTGRIQCEDASRGDPYYILNSHRTVSSPGSFCWLGTATSGLCRKGSNTSTVKRGYLPSWGKMPQNYKPWRLERDNCSSQKESPLKVKNSGGYEIGSKIRSDLKVSKQINSISIRSQFRESKLIRSDPISDRIVR